MPILQSRESDLKSQFLKQIEVKDLIFMVGIFWVQIGYVLCTKCKVFKCVTFPDYDDGEELSF